MNTDLIIAIVFFILGLIPAYYFYKKSLRTNEPAYSIKSINVIANYANHFPFLTVLYSDERVENFTVRAILFFNRGAAVLDGNDIAKLNPLRIVAKDCDILNSTVLAVNNTSSGFEANFDKSHGMIDIRFEYLNHNDGAVVQIVHNGVSSENLELIGNVKGVETIKRLPPSLVRVVSPPSPLNILGNVGLLFIGLTSAITLFLTSGITPAIFWGAIAFVSGFSIILLIVSSANFIRRAASTRIPRGLEIFDDDYVRPPA
jgi:hypothetical protein